MIGRPMRYEPKRNDACRMHHLRGRLAFLVPMFFILAGINLAEGEEPLAIFHVGMKGRRLSGRELAMAVP